jgi:uncharacterized RDD family membrane protein YckC
LESSSSSSPEPAAAKSFQYVGFWKRLVAAIIDILILLVIIVPIELAIFGTDYLQLAMAGKTLAVDVWVQLIIPLAAVTLFWRYLKATPGLLAISARIVDARTFAPTSAGKLAVRAVCLAVLLIAIIPLGIGLLWIGFDKRKQGWHDKIAGTVVIHDKD